MINKYISTLLFFLITSSILHAEVSSAVSITNSREAASSIKTLIKDNYSDFNNKIALPMTSGSTITTVDGSKSGTANITCNDDTVLLSNIYVTGSDNITINVNLDTDLNGSFEKNLSFSGISGLTTTGVFMCTSGATSCTYYNWTYTDSTLQLVATNRNSIAGAYCINDTCGSIYRTNLSKILNDLSGTISSVIQASTNLVVTSVNLSSSGTSSQIYAQKYSNCSNSTASEAVYTSSSRKPSEATLLSQANNASITSPTSAVLSTISANETTNAVSSSSLSDIKTVASTSTSSVTVSSTDPRDISYTSTYKDSTGSFVTSSASASINFQHIDPEYCMVEWSEVYTGVTTGGNVRGVTATGLRTTKKTETRLCSGAYNNICPISAGETIKYDCGNLDKSINQATASLNVLKGVVDDMICNVTE